MKNIIKISVAFLFAAQGACVPLDTPPLTSETDLNYWEKPTAALNTLNSCYTGVGNPSQIVYMDGASDNAHVRNNETNSIGDGSYSTADEFVASYWANRYGGIKMCNRLLNNINRVPELTNELRERYKAEARVIRALHYHELTVRYGDVPYYTGTLSVEEAKSIARTPRATVVENILAELNDVINNNYLPKSYSAAEAGRITHWTAMALKARVLLNHGRYSEVKPVTEAIITQSGYALHPDFAELFTVDGESNKEVMWVLPYALNYRENQGNYNFLPPSLAGTANVCPTNELVESYIMLGGKGIKEAGSGYNASDPWKDRDPRLKATVLYDGGSYLKSDGTDHVVVTDPDSGTANRDRFQYGAAVTTTTTGYYFKKFYDNQYITAQKSGLDYPVIRYADVLLMHAEACAETASLNSAEWDKTIKLLRTRAGFTAAEAVNLPAGKTTAELIDIVRNERRCELAFEGLRMQDIYRWKIAETVMNGNIHGMYTGDAVGTDDGFYIVRTGQFDKSRHYLWPVPQTERDINGNLGQNPGW